MWLYPQSIISKLGIDYAEEVRDRQQTIIAVLVSSGTIMNLHQASLQSSQAYPVSEYLDDVFAMVWKPLIAADEQQNSFRRQQQRSYVDFLGMALNPAQDNKDTKSTTATMRSDAVLYLEQHLDKVENYLKAQHADGLNGQHYKNLLLRIKKIREKYESGK